MKKKGWLGMSTKNLIALILFIIVFPALLILSVNTYNWVFKNSAIPERQVNRLRIVVAQTNGLPVESNSVTIPIEVGEQLKGEKKRYYQIGIYRKCQKGEKQGEDCRLKPAVCISDISEGGSNVKPFCEEIVNADFEETDTFTANRYFRVDKEEIDDSIIVKFS